jgi:ribosomal protein L40E
MNTHPQNFSLEDQTALVKTNIGLRKGMFMSRMTTLPTGAACLAVLIVLFLGPALHARVWTDKLGRQTEAKFIRISGDDVVLQKGAKPLIIPLAQLSDEDQEYVKSLAKNKGGAKKPAARQDDAESEEDFGTPSALKPKKPDAKASAVPNPFEDGDEDENAENSDKIEKSSQSDISKPAEKKPKTAKAEANGEFADGEFSERTWTDKKGNKITASFVRLDGSTVVLLKDGKEREFPMDRFVYDDKLYIRQAALEALKHPKIPAKGGDALAGTPAPVVSNPIPFQGGFSPSPASDAMQRMQAQQQANEALRQQRQQQQDAAAAAAKQAWDQQQQERRQQAEQERQARAEKERQAYEQWQQQVHNQAQAMENSRNGPPMPSFNTHQVETKVCMSCNQPVPSSATAGQRCPHCGVFWSVDKTTGAKAVERMPPVSASAVRFTILVIAIIGAGVGVLVWVCSR